MNDQDYWQRQHSDKPLFPDLFWSRPEQRRSSGKLLIIGGHGGSFILVAKAYEAALQAKVGSLRVLLPDKLRRTVDQFFPGAIYARSNISGGFAQSALENFLAESDWADGVLLAGDLGKNSETALVLEKYIQKFEGLLVVSHDALDYWSNSPLPILDRADTALVLNLVQLQQLFIASHSAIAITVGMGLTPLVECLHNFTLLHNANLVIGYEQMIVVASRGRVVSTSKPKEKPINLIQVASNVSVWWLQNPTKTIETLSCAVY
jgi:hypothetical protein